MKPEVEQRIIALVSWMNYHKRLARNLQLRGESSSSVSASLTSDNTVLTFQDPQQNRQVVVDVTKSGAGFYASTAFTAVYDGVADYSIEFMVSGSTVRAESRSKGNRYDATVSGSTVTLRSNSGESIVFDVY